MTKQYFDELAQRLRDRGMPDDEVTGTVDDLAEYVAESGTDPVEEFGTPKQFASRATPTGRMFWSRRFYAFLACYAAFVVAVCAAWIAFAPDDSRTTFVPGFVLGAVIVVAILAVRARHDRRQRKP